MSPRMSQAKAAYKERRSAKAENEESLALEDIVISWCQEEAAVLRQPGKYLGAA